MSRRVMVAMSGGVESSVAAVVLARRKYNVYGVTMRLFGDDSLALYDQNRLNFTKTDVDHAKEVASLFEFNHYVFNLSTAFHNEVVTRFTEGYLMGKTPNPCIYCNRYVKFGHLFKRARVMGMDYLSTGNFARIRYDDERRRWLLLKAWDLEADQSYMLYFLGQEQLSRLLLPLGDLKRESIFKMAKNIYWIDENKKDGEYVCFAKDGNYPAFLEETMGLHPRPGDFIDLEGNRIGSHKGLIHYTVGQRKGIGLQFDTPRYVLGKDVEHNTILLGEKKDLYRERLVAGDVNLISIEKLEEPMEVTAQIRFRSEEVPALLTPLPDGQIEVTFRQPQKAVTPGQAVVFYDGDIVVGGGTIL